MRVYENLIKGKYKPDSLKYPYRGFDATTTMPQYEATVKLKKAYLDETRRLEDIFRSDIAMELKLTNHPKEPIIWKLASQLTASHASIEEKSLGLAEIYHYYYKLSELVN